MYNVVIYLCISSKPSFKSIYFYLNQILKDFDHRNILLNANCVPYSITNEIFMLFSS